MQTTLIAQIDEVRQQIPAAAAQSAVAAVPDQGSECSEEEGGAEQEVEEQGLGPGNVSSHVSPTTFTLLVICTDSLVRTQRNSNR